MNAMTAERGDVLNVASDRRKARRIEAGMLCMARKACHVPDRSARGEVYVEIDYASGKRRELLFATWWEAELHAQRKRFLAVHACGFVPPETRIEALARGISAWERMVGATTAGESYIGWHREYLGTMDAVARARGDYDYETLMERLEREHTHGRDAEPRDHEEHEHELDTTNDNG